MTRWRRRPIVVDAWRWYANGDHPEDGPPDQEGRVVRRYRSPDHPGQTPCGHCGRVLHFHGWIDTSEGGMAVCPGDWIVAGTYGKPFPLRPQIFAEMHELLGQDDQR